MRDKDLPAAVAMGLFCGLQLTILYAQTDQYN